MKKIYKGLKYTAIFTVALSFGACKNYLDLENDSTLSQNVVFESVAYTEGILTGVYNQLQGDNGYGSRVSILYPMNTDDFKTSGDYNSLDRRGIGQYGAHPDNVELDGPFRQLYKGIERANICIKYIPLSNIYNNGTANERAQMRKMLGEALTLRALIYHELIRNWGDVPAHFEPASELLDVNLAKTDRDEIYNILIEDLRVASELVPWKSESNDPVTRITKNAIKALRARLALARGGYALRFSPREMARKGDYLDYYTIARNECKDLIDRGENGLTENFEQLFRSLHGSGIDSGNEWIFQIGAFGGNSRTDSKLGYSNGIRQNTNSSYGYANSGVAAVPTYFYEFDSIGDQRRDVTLAYFEIDANDNKALVGANDMRDGKFRKYWTNIGSTNQNLGINWPIIRYADVLLMFAEAENELSGAPTTDAVNAYEAVRRRGFKGYESRMGATPGNKEDFFISIMHERLLEFGGEGIRKYDLIRWNKLWENIQETRQKMTDFKDGVGRYAHVPEYIYQALNKVITSDVTVNRDDLQLYGGVDVATAYFTPSPVATTPAGYVRKDWRIHVKDAQITGSQGIAIKFVPNDRELYPIFNGILNLNFKLTQDAGHE
jgi:hypothetical protein